MLVRNLSANKASLNKSMERLASGLRINRAADDAAGLAVASNLSAQASIYRTSERNASDGVSVLQVADGALGNVSQMTGRLQELAMQASNGTLSAEQRGALQAEYNGIAQEVQRIGATTSFNGNQLLSDSSINIQVGGDSIPAATSGQSGSVASAAASLTSVDLTTQAGAQAALSQIQQFASTVTESQGAVGASANRLDSAQSTLAIQRENAVAAESRIRDADIAAEVANTANSEVRLQATVAAMAQANKSAASVLKLLG
jgi:flagellin